MDLTFAIVGCGRIAQRHAEHIQKFGILRAVCDIEYEKARQLAERTGARSYGSIDDLLTHEGDVDVVSVCTPNGLHAEHSVKALNAGHHVLCEKPMALTTYDCGEMIKAAERNNRRLFVVKQNRFNPPVVAVRRAVDEGRLGRIFAVQINCFWNRDARYYNNNWKGTRSLDGGILYTQFSHFIDLMYWLVGDVAEVTGFYGNFTHHGVIEFEDTGVVAFRLLNGGIGTISYTVSAFGKNMEGSLTLFGERGTVKIGGQYLNELEYQSIDGFSIAGLPEGRKANDYGEYKGSMSNHDKVYENLVDVLTHGGEISANCFEGMKTVEIIEKIYEASRRGAR